MRLVLVQPTLSFSLREDGSPDNLHRIRRLLDTAQTSFTSDDILLLPEHYEPRGERELYVEGVQQLARDYGLCVVGGSQHEQRGDHAVNAGVAVDAAGNVAGHYEKLRPYAAERARAVPGTRLGELELAGARLLVLICADFWFADLFQRAKQLPDLVLVPALSVSRKPTPDYSRSLWRHMAVARAYELGCFMGVSDWAHASELPMLTSSGVGGFADPTGTDPEGFFTPIPESGLLIVDVSLQRLRAFREDRLARGFFWKGAT